MVVKRENTFISCFAISVFVLRCFLSPPSLLTSTTDQFGSGPQQLRRRLRAAQFLQRPRRGEDEEGATGGSLAGLTG